MFTKEDLDSWNELFSDCKMNETDLSHPTEGFLTKTLVAYLRRFGYKVELSAAIQMDEQMQTREKRLFLIKLVRHIDHILKITDKSYTFTYYDLIRPTPKKTSHMLGILLNYLYYYNMFKTDVFEKADNGIQELQKLKQNISKIKEENEERKEEAAKMEVEIEQLETQVPAAEAELAELEAREVADEEEEQKLKNQLKELNLQKEELDSQKRSLKEQIVHDAEAHELQKQYNKLQADVKNQHELEAANERSLKERREQIDALIAVIKGVKEALTIVPPKLLETINENGKRLTALLNEHKKSTAIKEELLHVTKKKRQELLAVEQQLKLKNQQFEEQKAAKLQQIAAKEEQSHALNKELVQLKEEEHMLECALQEQRDIRTFIDEHMTDIMAPRENLNTMQVLGV